jgi:ribosomal protein S12 methylthiotransferase accessory factor
MNLLSKNCPLEESIAKMQSVLESVDCLTTFSQEKHPLQHCFSVNLASKEAPNHIYSNGKGIVSKACIASAYGEYIERLQTNNFFIDFHLPNRKYYPDEVAFEFDGNYLNQELHAIYNQNGELEHKDLVDFNSDYTEKIVCLPFVEYFSQEKIYVPINILSNLYVSNGLATGNSAKEAQVQALSEIFERHAKIEIIKNGYALPKIPDTVIQTFTRVHDDIKNLKTHGYIIEVLDASLDGMFPVTAISLINPKNNTLFVSFGAHPILEVCLERTLTELMQGRDLSNLDAFETPTFDMSIVADSFNIEAHFIDSNGKIGFPFLSAKKSFEYTPWKYEGQNTQDEYEFLLEIVKHLNKKIYLREYTYLGFYSCQMIVPNFSEVYPIEDMVYNNKNSGKLIRDMVLNFQNYEPNEILQTIETLDDGLNVELYIGVIFEEKFSLGEFKAQLLIHAGLHEEAIDVLENQNNKVGHIVAQLLRLNLGEYDWEAYEEALENIYGKQALQKAIDIIEQKALLISLNLHPHYYNMLELFDKLETKKAVLKP